MCVLAFTAHAHAELYKWTDSQGKVHYSDQPPTVKSNKITNKINNASPGQAEVTSAARKSLDAKDQDYQKRRKEADEARAKEEAKAEELRIQRENCAKARNNLSTLQNTPRVYSTDATGQRSYMDEAARTNALTQNQKAVSEYCK